MLTYNERFGLMAAAVRRNGRANLEVCTHRKGSGSRHHVRRHIFKKFTYKLGSSDASSISCM